MRRRNDPTLTLRRMFLGEGKNSPRDQELSNDEFLTYHNSHPRLEKSNAKNQDDTLSLRYDLSLVKTLIQSEQEVKKSSPISIENTFEDDLRKAIENSRKEEERPVLIKSHPHDDSARLHLRMPSSDEDTAFDLAVKMSLQTARSPAIPKAKSKASYDFEVDLALKKSIEESYDEVMASDENSTHGVNLIGSIVRCNSDPNKEKDRSKFPQTMGLKSFSSDNDRVHHRGIDVTHEVAVQKFIQERTQRQKARKEAILMAQVQEEAKKMNLDASKMDDSSIKTAISKINHPTTFYKI